MDSYIRKKLLEVIGAQFINTEYTSLTENRIRQIGLNPTCSAEFLMGMWYIIITQKYEKYFEQKYNKKPEKEDQNDFFKFIQEQYPIIKNEIVHSFE